jgi:hypothetical protein
LATGGLRADAAAEPFGVNEGCVAADEIRPAGVGRNAGAGGGAGGGGLGAGAGISSLR